jgi:hypothetical protein
MIGFSMKNQDSAVKKNVAKTATETRTGVGHPPAWYRMPK